jgi:hypothetical protein
MGCCVTEKQIHFYVFIVNRQKRRGIRCKANRQYKTHQNISAHCEMDQRDR